MVYMDKRNKPLKIFTTVRDRFNNYTTVIATIANCNQYITLTRNKCTVIPQLSKYPRNNVAYLEAQ